MLTHPWPAGIRRSLKAMAAITLSRSGGSRIIVPPAALKHQRSLLYGSFANPALPLLLCLIDFKVKLKFHNE
jgi:hypothetical protein